MVTLSGPEGTLLTVNLGTSVVLGASNLTTAGAVPFVTSSGTLGQDGSNLFWDNTNKRLGIRTTSPSVPLEVKGASTNSTTLKVLSSGGNALLSMFETSGGDGQLYIHNSSGSAMAKINSAGASYITAGTLGIGPSNTAPTGTLSVVDRTAATGATLLYVGTDATNVSATTCKQVNRAGTAQSTTNLHEWQSAAGGVLTAIAPGGGLILSNAAAPTLANSQFTLHLASNTSLVITAKGSDGVSRTVALTLA